MRRYNFSAAAAPGGLAVVIPWRRSSIQRDGSLNDNFLASITDSEAQMIVDWPVEDIPEYY